jgi:acyl carrier protein
MGDADVGTIKDHRGDRAGCEEYDQRLTPLTDDLVLIDSGLDSLAFAELVVRLEGQLGVDPFTTSQELEFPVTLRDLISTYEDALKSHAV